MFTTVSSKKTTSALLHDTLTRSSFPSFLLSSSLHFPFLVSFVTFIFYSSYSFFLSHPSLLLLFSFFILKFLLFFFLVSIFPSFHSLIFLLPSLVPNFLPSFFPWFRSRCFFLSVRDRLGLQFDFQLFKL